MEENKSGEFELQSCVVTSLGNPVVWDACEVMYIMADLGCVGAKCHFRKTG